MTPTPDPAPLGWGLIGCGAAGRAHTRWAAAEANTTVRAFCDVDAPAAEIKASIQTVMDDICRTISFGIGMKNKQRVQHRLFDDGLEPASDQGPEGAGAGAARHRRLRQSLRRSVHG